MIRMRIVRVCLMLAAVGAAGGVQAQQANSCPQLPADAGLTWDVGGSARTQLCRALRADGSEAFGLVISDKPAFEPQRGDRAETGQVGGRDVVWYRAELAQKPGTQARETLLQLPDGRSMHVWLQAPSDDALLAGFKLVGAMRLDAPEERVAGQ
jgi:hypothetical protein